LRHWQLTAGLARIEKSDEHHPQLGRDVDQTASASNEAQELTGYIRSEAGQLLISRFWVRAPRLRRRRPACIDRAVAQVEHNPPLEVSIFKNYSPDVRPFPLDVELMERVFAWCSTRRRRRRRRPR
jgi:hypothetical protein